MSDVQFSFERLRVWQDARRWVGGIYSLTRGFPSDERYGLTSQLNRAAVSVTANLAEGCGRTSLKDQAHFSQIAYSSLMESACLLIIAKDLELISEKVATEERTKVESIANQINALRKSQLVRK